MNLEQLPQPSLFYEPNFEAELKALQDQFIALDPSYETLLLESDPVNKLLQTFAYRTTLLKNEVNEKLKQCMLAFATGSNLDHIAANSVTVRHEGESDESLRYRASIAPEGFTSAGPKGAYEYHALSASKEVMHATVLAHTPKAGYVTVVLLSNSDDGEASESLRDHVQNYLSQEERIPLLDRVHVEPARFLDVAIKLRITYQAGANIEETNQRILAALEYMSELNVYEKKAKNLFKPKEMLTRNQIHKAARVYGVQNVEVISPATDIQPAPKEAIRIVERTIEEGGFYE